MLLAYTAIAIVTVLLTLGLLAATKVPTIVALLAATIVTGVTMALGRLELGYWDPFAPIAATFCWFFTAIVSLAFIGVGRLLKWQFFLGTKRAKPIGSQGAL
jgi:hypothetical protein